MSSVFQSRLRWTAWVFLAFVVYASLIPWEFASPPTSFSWQRFFELPPSGWGRLVREDGLAHIIGYGALAFLLRAAIAGPAGRESLSRVRDFLLVCSGSLLALAMEYVQQYIPARGVSVGDFAASVIGSVAGVVSFHLLGQAVLATIPGSNVPRRSRVPTVLAWYTSLYLVLALFPFDFPFSMSELRQALSADRHAWVWTQVGCSSMLSCMARLGLEAVIAVPVGMWWIVQRTRGSTSGVASALAAMGFSLAIELAQIFLLSGTSQGVSALFRALGMVAGAEVARRFDPRWMAFAKSIVRPVVVAAWPLYLFSVAAVSGWFRAGRVSGDETLFKLAEIRFLPFYYHHFAGETAAVASLFVHAALYAPVGVFVWLWRQSARRPSAGESGWIPTAMAVLIATVAEAGKLFVDGQRPDPTDILIAAAAAWLAYRTCQWIAGTRLPFAPPKPATPARILHAASPPGGGDDSRMVSVTRPSILQRLIGAVLLVLATWGVLRYSLGMLPLAVVLVPASMLVWFRPQWALVVVLAALPVFNLAPWSGQFFIDEFDVLLAATLGIAWLRSDGFEGAWRDRPGLRLSLMMLVAVWLVACSRGLLPLASFDVNAFASYYSPYNALRVGKGLLWAVLLAPLVIRDVGGRAQGSSFVIGMSIGLALTVLSVVWERFLFAGIFNFSNDYRITGLFSGVHTGGAFVEGYLVTAVPFLVPLTLLMRGRQILPVAATVFLGACYGVLVTYARAGYLALGLAVAIVVAGLLFQVIKQRVRSRRMVMGAFVMVFGGLAIALPIALGPYAINRFSTLDEDMAIRVRHWEGAIEMMDRDVVTRLLGMGLGTFPRTYLTRNNDMSRPTTFAFVKEGGNTFLRLGAGEMLYFAQRAQVEPGTSYRLQVDLRGDSRDARLTVPLCEKFILYSFECAKTNIVAPGSNGRWVANEIELNTRNVGAPIGRFKVHRPTQFAMFNPDKNTLIEVDNLRLLDDRGHNLLVNGDFESGMDRWFFSTDRHWPWHIENIGVQLFFESGALGLLVISLITITTLMRTSRSAWRGDILGLVCFSSLVAFLTVGMFNSLFDEPRLTLLYFVVLMVAIGRSVGAKDMHPSLS